MVWMLIFLALICVLAGMAFVAISVNEFSKKMEEFRKILETRYILEPLAKPVPKAKDKAQSPAQSDSPLEALLKKTQDSLTKKP